MFTPIDELKVQAKKLIKQSNAAQILAKITKSEPQLKHAQLYIARKWGFGDWNHARAILSCEQDNIGNIDSGSFWHSPRCDVLLNKWCKTYTEAREIQAQHEFVLPFKNQFIVVKEEYLTALKIPNAQQHWQKLNNDWCTGDKETRQQIALLRLRSKNNNKV